MNTCLQYNFTSGMAMRQCGPGGHGPACLYFNNTCSSLRIKEVGYGDDDDAIDIFLTMLSPDMLQNVILSSMGDAEVC